MISISLPRWQLHLAVFLLVLGVVYIIPLVGVPSYDECAGDYQIVCGTNGIVLSLKANHTWHLVAMNNRMDTLATDHGVWWREVYYRDRLKSAKSVYFVLYQAGKPGSPVVHHYDDVGLLGWSHLSGDFSSPVGFYVARLRVSKPIFNRPVIENAEEICGGGQQPVK